MFSKQNHCFFARVCCSEFISRFAMILDVQKRGTWVEVEKRGKKVKGKKILLNKKFAFFAQRNFRNVNLSQLIFLVFPFSFENPKRIVKNVSCFFRKKCILGVVPDCGHDHVGLRDSFCYSLSYLVSPWQDVWSPRARVALVNSMFFNAFSSLFSLWFSLSHAHSLILVGSHFILAYSKKLGPNLCRQQSFDPFDCWRNKKDGLWAECSTDRKGKQEARNSKVTNTWKREKKCVRSSAKTVL